MEHSYFKDRISAYHDNELKDEQRHLIAEHLKDCAECRQLLEELEKFDRLVEKHSGLGESEYWESAAQKIDQAIGGESAATRVVDIRRPAWRGLSWKLVGVAASFVILAFIALYERDISDEVVPFRQVTTAPAPSPQLDSSAVAVKKQPTAGESIDGYISPVADSLPVEEARVELKATAEADRLAARKEVVVSTPPSPTIAEPESKNELAEKAGEEPTVVADIYDEAPSETETQAPPLAVPKIVEAPTGDAEVSGPADLMMELGHVEELPLEYWRHRRDSLLASVSSTDSVRIYRAPVTTTAELTRQVTEPEKAKVSTAPKKDRPVEIEKLLLEAQYQVALLTDDEEERNRAVDFLTRYLGDDDDSLRQAAVDYLALLPKKE